MALVLKVKPGEFATLRDGTVIRNATAKNVELVIFTADEAALKLNLKPTTKRVSHEPSSK